LSGADTVVGTMDAADAVDTTASPADTVLPAAETLRCCWDCCCLTLVAGL